MEFEKIRSNRICKLLVGLNLFLWVCCSTLLAQTQIITPKRNPFKKPALIKNVRQSGYENDSRIVSEDKSFSNRVLPTKPTINSFREKHESVGPDKLIGNSAMVQSTASINASEVIEPGEGNQSDEISINFEAVDLMSLVRYLSQETGKGFIINQAIKGDVTIISPVTLTKEESLAMLESILQVRGYTAVPSGKMFKIVSLSDAKVAGTETRTENQIENLTDDDTLITQIIPLQKTSAAEAQGILANLLPRDCSMLLFPPSNTIVLTGRSVSIKRALEVLQELEKGLLKPGLDIVPLKFSSANEMRGQLEKIIASGGVKRDEIKGGVTFLSDKRSNSILVLTSPENFSKVRALIDRLDISYTDARPELTEFFSLKYADESDTVKQLENILGIGGTREFQSASESAEIETTRLVPIKRTRSIMITTRSSEVLKRIKGLLIHLDASPVKDASEVRVIRITNADAKVLADTLTRLVQNKNSATTGTAKRENEISFVAESHTNSIIMTGSSQMFSHYEDIIKNLDVMRPQILVEMLISEVSGNLIHTLGIEWNVMDMTSSKWRAFGGTNYDLKGNPLSNQGFQIGLVQEVLDPVKLASGNLSELSKIKAMVKAYKNNSNFKILSAPQILTTDNEEANLSVGEVVALPQGFTQDRDTGRFDLTNFKYEDVGIVLSITPRVNSNDLVTLKIDQEIKKRQEENLYEFNVPVLTKRQMNTTITVPNHKTIVIGGLMREDKTKVVERVPLLSNIPVIGEAFKNRRTVTQKTSLLVFLTPHILTSPEEVLKFDEEQTKNNKLSQENLKEIDQKMEKSQNSFKEKAMKVFQRLGAK